MAASNRRKFTRWIVDQLWDTPGPARAHSWGGLRPAWKLIAAIAGSALLDWVEWAEHHPPQMIIVALIHFVFVVALISIVVHLVRWFRPGEKI